MSAIRSTKAAIRKGDEDARRIVHASNVKDGEDMSPTDAEARSSSDAEEPNVPRPNKGKERAHTPSDDEMVDADDEDEEGGDDDESEEKQRDSTESDGGDSDAEDENEEDTSGPIYHWQIWDELVNRASGPSSRAYVHEPDHGRDPMDVTSYRSDQVAWGPARATRPSILSRWSPPVPRNIAAYRHPVRYMRFDGRLVLDWQGRNIKMFRNQPLTISSAVEGWRVEAWMRNDSRIGYRDFEARMRTTITPTGRKPIFDHKTLACRTKEFRHRAGIITWNPSSYPQMAVRNFLDSLRTPAQRALNRAIDHDLTSAERAQLKSISSNYPRYPRSVVAAGAPTPNASASNQLTASAHNAGQTSQGNSSQRPSTIVRGTPALSSNTEAPSSSNRGLSLRSPVQDSTVNDMIDASESLSSHRPSSEPEDPSDARNDFPTTLVEQECLRDALEQTVDDYIELSGGRQPYPADPTENYFSQWSHYQRQMEMTWRQLSSNPVAPSLFGMKYWTGGIKNWDSTHRVPVAGVVEPEENMADYDDDEEGSNSGDTWSDVD